MATVADRVRETTSTTGTGALTLAGATPGCRTFNAAIGNAVPCFYTLLDANGTGWECGIGQLSSSTSFTRTTIQKSSNANAAISLSAGTHTLMCALTEGWASTFNVDASGNVGMNMTPASTVVLDLKEPDAATDLIVGLSAGTGARAQIRSVAQADGTSSEVAIHTTTGGVTSEKFRFNGAGKLSGPTFALERTADGQLFINASAAAGYVTINTAGSERYRADQSGNHTFSGPVSVSTATAAAFATRSASSSLPSYATFGRTSAELYTGVSGGASNLTTGDVAGDSTVRAATRLWLAIGPQGHVMMDATVGVRIDMPAVFVQPLRYGQYTLATLPSAAAFSGYFIVVTDATGGAKLCRSSGSVWQLVNTTTTVS